MKKLLISLSILLCFISSSQTAQKFEFILGFNSCNTLSGKNEFFPGYNVIVQTAIPSKKNEYRLLCIGVDYKYFVIKAEKQEGNTTIKVDGLNVLSISTSQRIAFKKLSDNYFQIGLGLNFSYSDKSVGFGPRLAFGIKLIDKAPNKFYLSPLIGLNIFSPGNERVVCPYYVFASLRLIYQFGKVSDLH